MKNQLFHLILFFLLSAIYPVSTVAQTFAPTDAIESVGSGTVNWTTSEVYAVGIGAPPASGANPAQVRAMAERAAHVVALRNLLETVKGVRVDAETVVQNFLVTSDVIRTRVEGVVKGARVVKKRYLSDGSVEMLVAMPLRGAFLNAITPETFGRDVPAPGRQFPEPKGVPEKKAEPVPPIPPTAPEKRAKPVPPAPAQPAPPSATKVPEPPSTHPAPTVPEKKTEPAPLPQPKPQLPEKMEEPGPPAGSSESTIAFKGGVATGVVIDGRGLGLRPALLPRVIDPQGQEIYVGQIVTRTNAVEQGVAGYAKDVNAAKNNFRVTDNPAVLKGVQAAGAARTDVMVAQADAQALRDLARRGDFLSNCRVIIVY